MSAQRRPVDLDGPPPRPVADAEGPPPVPRHALTPRPADPGRHATSPSIGASTRARIEQADSDRAADLAATTPGSHMRTTIALGLGAAALAAAWRLFGGRGE